MTYPITFRRLVSLGAFLGVCTYLPTVASAQTASYGDGPRTEVVSYADLDLGGTAGRQVLSRRIHAAAVRVCGPAADAMSLDRRGAYGSCMTSAQRGALQTVVATGALNDRTKVAELASLR